MSTYEPGTVAVATVPNYEARFHGVIPAKHSARVSRYKDGWALLSDPDVFWPDHRGDVTDIRPLPVLDLDAVDLALLRNSLARWTSWSSLKSEQRIIGRILDEVEAQTKLPRIPEPGLWGVVEAHVEGSSGPRATYQWVRTPTGWEPIGSAQPGRHWLDLIDPVLIREGLE